MSNIKGLLERSRCFLERHGVLCLVFAVVLFLGFFRSWELRLWIDEFYSINIAQRPLGDIWSLASHPGKFYYNTTPPLYETILHFVWSPSGTAIMLARMLSLFFYFLGLLFTYKLARLVFDKEVATLSVFLIGLNLAFIRYSTMIRCYSLLFALTAMSLWLFFRMLRGKDFKKRWLFLLLLTNVAILYTFYFGAFVVLMEILLAFFVFKGSFPKRILLWLSSAYLFFGFWLGHLWEDMHKEDAVSPELSPDGDVFGGLLSRLTEGFFGDPFLASLYGVAFVGIMMLMIKSWRQKDPLIKWLLAFLLFFIVPVGAVNALTFRIVDEERMRYFLSFAPGFFVLVAWFVHRLPVFFRVLFLSALLFFSCRTGYSYWNQPSGKFGPLEIAYLAEEAKKVPLGEDELCLIEIETDHFVPIFAYYFLGPEFLYKVSYPTLWSGVRMIADFNPQYFITYNIAAFPNRHFFFSASRLNRADKLMLVSSTWHNSSWEGSFLQEYQKALRQQGFSGYLELEQRKDAGDFCLLVFRVVHAEQDEP